MNKLPPFYGTMRVTFKTNLLLLLGVTWNTEVTYNTHVAPKLS